MLRGVLFPRGLKALRRAIICRRLNAKKINRFSRTPATFNPQVNFFRNRPLTSHPPVNDIKAIYFVCAVRSVFSIPHHRINVKLTAFDRLLVMQLKINFWCCGAGRTSSPISVWMQWWCVLRRLKRRW
mmetsp:Transcript_36347/g.94524  ORF Transcript_36347/g.94524 Transcript_36347/m.94524 type:complete len:128 (+) Transcript_36347:4044-4427(+)